MKQNHVYPINDDGPILNGHDSLLVEWVKDPLVLGPGDELDRRVGLYVAPDDALEAPRDVLDVGVEGDARGV